MGYYCPILEARKRNIRAQNHVEISNIYIYIYIYSIISNIHTWYFQQQKIKASSMKAILSILHTGTFLMDCLNEVIEQCHQCPVGNTVLNEEGPNALQGGKDIKAKSQKSGKISYLIFASIQYLIKQKNPTKQKKKNRPTWLLIINFKGTETKN